LSKSFGGAKAVDNLDFHVDYFFCKEYQPF
jgi:hypothetical protein